MQVFEQLCLKSKKSYYRQEIDYNSGMQNFVKYFDSNIVNDSQYEFRKKGTFKSKTLKGNISEIKNKIVGKKSIDIFVRELVDYTLIIFEDEKLDYNYLTGNKTKTGISHFNVFKLRNLNEDEIKVKASEEAKKKNFDINNLSISYITKVWVTSDTGLRTNVDGLKKEVFNTFEEARAYVDKIRKAWTLQMTLNGLSNDIKHDFNNTLTVYKSGCSRKFVSRFGFLISGKTTYKEPNAEFNTETSY